GVMRKHRVVYQPSGETVHVPDGTTLFNAAHWAGLPIESACGGRGTCGKCLVRIEQGDFEATPADHRHLPDRLADGWRLSCQAVVATDAACEVPRLSRTPKAATMGVGRFVLLEPNVAKHLLRVSAPSLEDARPHLQRIEDELLDAESIEVTHDAAI